jgi:L-alanine-DL-glutamate epimerase-like enolase superfamily enzyme
LAQLREYISKQHSVIDANPAAWSAIEMALLDLMGKSSGVPVESLFELPRQPSEYVYSAILGDSSPETFKALFFRYRQLGYTDFKMKLAHDAERDRRKIESIREALPHITLRADANNLWPSGAAAQQHLAHLNVTFAAIEEPLQSKNLDDLQALADATGTKIILDESLLVAEQLAALTRRPATWIVNARNSKYGGLIRSLAMIKELVSHQIEIIVGAHVGESSLLTRASLLLADAAKQQLRGQEGGFSTHLLTWDMFEPNLKIGSAGKFAPDLLACRDRPGFGLMSNGNWATRPEVVALAITG